MIVKSELLLTFADDMIIVPGPMVQFTFNTASMPDTTGSPSFSISFSEIVIYILSERHGANIVYTSETFHWKENFQIKIQMLCKFTKLSTVSVSLGDSCRFDSIV